MSSPADKAAAAAASSKAKGISVTPIVPASWPPIITDATKPLVFAWRDRFLTFAMWLVLLWFSRRGFLALWHALFGTSGNSPASVLSIAERWARLEPYFLVVAVAGIALILSALAQLRRKRLALVQPQPKPLALSEQASRAGCSENELTRWREMKVCVADLDAKGRLSVS